MSEDPVNANYPPGTVAICSPLSLQAYFADDVTGTCADCGIAVCFRPYVPKHVIKICVACAEKRAIRKGSKLKTRVTQQTLAELALYYSKGTKQ